MHPMVDIDRYDASGSKCRDRRQIGINRNSRICGTDRIRRRALLGAHISLLRVARSSKTSINSNAISSNPQAVCTNRNWEFRQMEPPLQASEIRVDFITMLATSI